VSGAKLIPVKVVWQLDIDGRRQSRVGVFTHKNLSAAIAAASNKGAWGGEGEIADGQAVEVDGKFYLLENIPPVDLDGQASALKEKLKQQALAKLTLQEREALGLVSADRDDPCPGCKPGTKCRTPSCLR